MSWLSLKRYQALERSWSQVRQRLPQMLPGGIVALLVLGLLKLGGLTPFEQLTYTALFRVRGPEAWSEEIAIIAIDDPSIKALGFYPWPRRRYAELLNRLAPADASVIAFDIVFSEISPDDAELIAAMEQVNGVVLAQVWDKTNAPLAPIPEMPAIAVGHIHRQIDSDGITRQILPQIREVPFLAVAVTRVYALVQEAVPLPPLDRPLWVNWPGSASDLPHYSFVDVIEGKISPDVFRDKIVLIGITAQTGFDPLVTPFDQNSTAHGVHLHAAVLSNLLQQNYLISLDDRLLGLLLLLGGPLLSLVATHRRLAVQFILWLGTCLAWTGLCLLAFKANLLLPIAAPWLLCSGTLGSVALLERLRMNAQLRARSDFLATMSHEIRTPMNAVIAMTDLLRETELTSQQQEFVETIHHSGNALLAVIDDILNFSKIEAGRLEIEHHPLNLRDCIETSLELVAPKAADKDLELAYWMEPKTPSLIASDGTRVRQILINLLSNAVKFTEQGEVVVMVQARPLRSQRPDSSFLYNGSSRESDSRYEIQVSVKDTGIGIPADRLHRLFESFSQVDASISRRYGGTGLGLAISKRLSKLMGGTMWVESQPGVGSTFYFTIQADQLVQAKTPNLTELQLQFVGKRGLIVEPHATTRSILVQQLTCWGMTVVACQSETAAIAKLDQQTPLDFAIVAWQLPELDVNRLAEVIHQKDPYQTLPIVAIASSSQPELANKTGYPHLFACLSKPLKLTQLYEKLHQSLIDPMQEPASLPAQQVISPATSAEAPSLRILLAEDNVVNQTVALRVLERLGYQADVANNGTEVLALMERKTYDVVLMDMQMPDMDGLTATRQVRDRIPAGDQPWIIALTANAMERDRERCLAAGMDDYLSKPIRKDRLAELLTQCQGRKRAWEGPLVDAMPVRDATAVDPKTLQALREMIGEHDSGLLVEVIDNYLADSPQLLQAIVKAVGKGNRNELKQSTHTLRSTSAMLGATALAQLCRELERLNLAEALPHAQALISRIEAEYERVKAELAIARQQ